MSLLINLLFAAVCLAAPFAFVFFLIYAIRDAVKGGDRDIAYGIGAAVSLLVIVAVCVLCMVS